jgi:hypothetical protein
MKPESPAVTTGPAKNKLSGSGLSPVASRKGRLIAASPGHASGGASKMSSARITVYRGVRVTKESLTTITDGRATTTYSYKAHPRKTLVTAESLAEIHERMDVVLGPKP